MEAWNPLRLFRKAEVVPVAEVKLDEAAWPPYDYYAQTTPPAVFKSEEALAAVQVRWLKAIDLTTPRSCLKTADDVVERVNQTDDDDLLSLFDRIRSEPYNFQLLLQVACILQSLTSTGHISRGSRPALASGTNGVVMPGVLPNHLEYLFSPNSTPPYILKAALSEQREGDVITEAAVGLYGTNSLRSEIPNFMFVYGAYRCGRATVRGMKNRHVDTCTTGAGQGLYVMLETISDAPTLGAWIDDHALSPDLLPTLNTYMIQVLLALAVARERLNYCHGDLSADNVMLRPISAGAPQHGLLRPISAAPVTLRYRVGGKTYFVVSDRIATLIDFGRSHLEVPVDAEREMRFRPLLLDVERAEKVPTSIEHALLGATPDATATVKTGYVFYSQGLSPLQPCSLYDVCHFVNACAMSTGEETVQAEIWTWLRPFFATRDGFRAWRARRFEWRGSPHWDRVPIGIDISLPEYIETVLPLWPTPPATTRYNPSTMPPLFECDPHVGCAKSPVRVAVRAR